MPGTVPILQNWYKGTGDWGTALCTVLQYSESICYPQYSNYVDSTWYHTTSRGVLTGILSRYSSTVLHDTICNCIQPATWSSHGNTLMAVPSFENVKHKGRYKTWTKITPPFFAPSSWDTAVDRTVDVWIRKFSRGNSLLWGTWCGPMISATIFVWSRDTKNHACTRYDISARGRSNGCTFKMEASQTTQEMATMCCDMHPTMQQCMLATVVSHANNNV
jgi:hypothetical protein